MGANHLVDVHRLRIQLGGFVFERLHVAPAEFQRGAGFLDGCPRPAGVADSQLAAAASIAAVWVFAHTMRMGVTRKRNLLDSSLSTPPLRLTGARIEPLPACLEPFNGFHGVELCKARCLRLRAGAVCEEPIRPRGRWCTSSGSRPPSVRYSVLPKHSRSTWSAPTTRNGDGRTSTRCGDFSVRTMTAAVPRRATTAATTMCEDFHY